jgi:hypothetical protein
LAAARPLRNTGNTRLIELIGEIIKRLTRDLLVGLY